MIFAIPIILIIANNFLFSPGSKFSTSRSNSKKGENIKETKFTEIAAQFASLENKRPAQWGYYTKGVKTRLNSGEKVLALTLDACGSQGDGFDKKLIEFLKKERIPATIFLSNKWIEKNHDSALALAGDKLFEMANHGYAHLPCSANGEKAFGIRGTGNVLEIIEEIEKNSRALYKLNGRQPKYYRSGTAHYDEICMEIAQRLGYQVIGFSLNGDAGVQYSRGKVKRIISQAKPGSIILLHMNHPEKRASLGFMDAFFILRKNNYKFVYLSEFKLIY